MKPVTTNYGIAGGTLNATKHLEAAIPRLLNASEQQACLRCEMAVATATQPGRAVAELN